MYCACGCGGLVKPSPNYPGLSKYLHGHNARRTPHDYEERDMGHETPCWIWVRTIQWGGYGMVRRKDKNVLAHIAYYEEEHGPVPAGLEIDHVCGMPACVNPEHLEAVTHSENVRRAFVRREGTPTNWIRKARFSLGWTQRELAYRLGTEQSVVSAWENERTRPSPWLQERLDHVLADVTGREDGG